MGATYEITGDAGPGASTSFSFTKMEMSTDPQVLNALYGNYVPYADISSARWLSASIPQNSPLYADGDARQHVLRGYAMWEMNPNDIFSNNTQIAKGSYVYLRYFNVKGYYVDSSGNIVNMTNILSQVKGSDLIYSNGESKIYFCSQG